MASSFPALHSFPTRRSSDLGVHAIRQLQRAGVAGGGWPCLKASLSFVARNAGRISPGGGAAFRATKDRRSEEHTSELQSLRQLVCRLRLHTKKVARLR